MSRKAVELSLNTVIVAAIVLLVLIVLILIFTGQMGKYTRGLNDCAKKGGGSDYGDCKPSAACMDAGGIPSGDCIFYNEDGSKRDGWQNNQNVCCVIKKV
jgi:hypothetical protein